MLRFICRCPLLFRFVTLLLFVDTSLWENTTGKCFYTGFGVVWGFRVRVGGARSFSHVISATDPLFFFFTTRPREKSRMAGRPCHTPVFGEIKKSVYLSQLPRKKGGDKCESSLGNEYKEYARKKNTCGGFRRIFVGVVYQETEETKNLRRFLGCLPLTCFPPYVTGYRERLPLRKIRHRLRCVHARLSRDRVRPCCRGPTAEGALVGSSVGVDGIG